MKETQEEHFHSLSFWLGVSATVNIIGWGRVELLGWADCIDRLGFYNDTIPKGLGLIILGVFFVPAIIYFRRGEYVSAAVISGMLNLGLLVCFSSDVGSAIDFFMLRIVKPSMPWLALLAVGVLFVWAVTEVTINFVRWCKKKVS